VTLSGKGEARSPVTSDTDAVAVGAVLSRRMLPEAVEVKTEARRMMT
jgi:hypothetical protein